MVIDNTRVVVHDRKMMYMIAIILAAIVGAIIILEENYEELFYKVSHEVYITIAVVLYVLYNVFKYLKDLNYIFYSDNGDKITFKFYSLRPFAKKRQSYEIAKSSFIKYETEKSLFGFKESIIIYQRIKNKTAKYPPLSISSLTKQEKGQLFASLIANSKQKTN